MENILKGIKAFVFDVDGVLTDGSIFADMDGELLRTFDSKDGFALRMAYMHGYRLGVISGGRSESIRLAEAPTIASTSASLTPSALKSMHCT